MLEHSYQAFGLRIGSRLEIPEFTVAATEKPDLTIQLSPLEIEQFGGEGEKNFHSASTNSFFLQIENVARYHVENGNSISIDPSPKADPFHIRVFLLGTVMGALLHQRGLLPLHGSAISSKEGAVLFLGASGIGKSSLAAALYRRGYAVLCDDICALSFAEGNNIFVHPAYPQLKLDTDTAHFLQIEPQSIIDKPSLIEKHRISFSASYKSCLLPLSQIFILNQHSGKEVVISSLQGIDKFIQVANTIYRGTLMEPLEISAHQFTQCTRLCDTIPAHRISRPRDGFSLKKLCEMMMCYI